jgi:hypothetical protein
VALSLPLSAYASASRENHPELKGSLASPDKAMPGAYATPGRRETVYGFTGTAPRRVWHWMGASPRQDTFARLACQSAGRRYVRCCETSNAPVSEAPRLPTAQSPALRWRPSLSASSATLVVVRQFIGKDLTILYLIVLGAV